MKAIRKICTNLQQIQAAHNINAQLEYEGRQAYMSPMRVPTPLYDTVQYNYKPVNVIDFHIDPIDKDIIVLMQGRGEVRLEYDPLVESQLEMIMSLHNL